MRVLVVLVSRKWSHGWTWDRNPNWGIKSCVIFFLRSWLYFFHFIVQRFHHFGTVYLKLFLMRGSLNPSLDPSAEFLWAWPTHNNAGYALDLIHGLTSIAPSIVQCTVWHLHLPVQFWKKNKRSSAIYMCVFACLARFLTKILILNIVKWKEYLKKKTITINVLNPRSHSEHYHCVVAIYMIGYIDCVVLIS